MLKDEINEIKNAQLSHILQKGVKVTINKHNEQKTVINKVDIYQCIINHLVKKRQRLSKWIKNKTQLYVVYKKATYICTDTGRLKVKD